MTNKRSIARSVSAILVALLASATLSARAESKSEPVAILTMGDVSMSTIPPARVTIQVGDTVEWVNASAQIHMVRSLPGSPGFRSKYLNPGEKFEYKFTEAGTYRYAWITHSSVQGSSPQGYIIVTPEPAVAGSGAKAQ